MRASDQQLLRRITAGGDAEAFSLVINRYADLVFSTGWRILRNESRAADVAQETFFQLFKSADRVSGCLSGWLHSVATRRAIDIVRQEEARHKREEQYTRDVLSSGNAWNEVEPVVDEALEKLDPESRDLLTMHFLEQKSMAQVASALGVSQPTVSRRIASALEQMRQSLQAQGIVVGIVPLQTILLHSLQLAPETLLRTLGKMALANAVSAKGAGAVTAYASSVGAKILYAGGVAIIMYFSVSLLIRSPQPRPVVGPIRPQPVLPSAPPPPAEPGTVEKTVQAEVQVVPAQAPTRSGTVPAQPVLAFTRAMNKDNAAPTNALPTNSPAPRQLAQTPTVPRMQTEVPQAYPYDPWAAARARMYVPQPVRPAPTPSRGVLTATTKPPPPVVNGGTLVKGGIYNLGPASGYGNVRFNTPQYAVPQYVAPVRAAPPDDRMKKKQGPRP